MLVVGSGDWWAGKGGDGDQGEWLWRGVLRGVDLRCLRPTMWLDLGHWSVGGSPKGIPNG